MKFGFSLSGLGCLADPDALASIACRGDELGFEWLLTGDHFVPLRQQMPAIQALNRPSTPIAFPVRRWTSRCCCPTWLAKPGT